MVPKAVDQHYLEWLNVDVSLFMWRYDVRDFTKPVSSKGISIYDIDISAQEMEMYIDLQPFVNPTPYIVPEDMSLTKVIHLSIWTLCRKEITLST